MNETYHSPYKNTFHWPDIRQNRVNMVKCYSSDIWKYESSSRPNYKGWRKETEALLKPPHLKQVSWSREKQIRKDYSHVFHLFYFSHPIPQSCTYHPQLFHFSSAPTPSTDTCSPSISQLMEPTFTHLPYLDTIFLPHLSTHNQVPRTVYSTS